MVNPGKPEHQAPLLQPPLPKSRKRFLSPLEPAPLTTEKAVKCDSRTIAELAVFKALFKHTRPRVTQWNVAVF